jgi:hypothetical protein
MIEKASDGDAPKGNGFSENVLLNVETVAHQKRTEYG